METRMRDITNPLLFIGFALTLGAALFVYDLRSLVPQTRSYLAAVFFADSSTETSLINSFNAARFGGRKMRILIVPGHDSEQWGTEFNGMREADLTLELGKELYATFKADPLFDAYLARTDSGYSPILQSYFSLNRDAILRFIDTQRTMMHSLLGGGIVRGYTNVEHNVAPTDTAFTLYGINKWASENSIDIVLHIHFNDYPGRPWTRAGKYSGFSIYVPERQYSNAKGSQVLALAVSQRLKKFYAQSNLPKEDVTVVEDQELIAVGANNSLDSAGLLIEYGYIYEPGFLYPDSRAAIFSDLALQTYLGVTDLFGLNAGKDFATRLVPHRFERDLEKGQIARRDVVSLQAALVLEDVYPPKGVAKNECGITGIFGSCTEAAVKAFQNKYGIFPAQGVVGERTRQKLHELYF